MEDLEKIIEKIYKDIKYINKDINKDNLNIEDNFTKQITYSSKIYNLGHLLKNIYFCLELPAIVT